ncbi:hypothetical protein HYT56_04500 [Candidatus Woesearchaeota archaeon]|nr:hypothetical protein [Candidatus Woesearchaeota archaeon]
MTRYYTLVFEKDDTLGMTVSYLEKVNGRESTEPSDDVGRSILKDKVRMVSEMDLKDLFKHPNEKRLEMKIEIFL